MRTEEFEDGVAICGDCSDSTTLTAVRAAAGPGGVGLIVTDPPYGNVVAEGWDRWKGDQRSFVDWMMGWTKSYADLLPIGGAVYIWGGYGRPGFRPFFEYVARLESETQLRMANFITWGKKRAYGVQNNYLATREDCAYLVKGDPKKPAVFNVPLLDTKRGYSGYNEKYPAKSEYYRRTNVWTDVTELLRGKVHPTQKPLRVYEVPMEVSSRPGDCVVDPFAGSMTAAWAARKLGRRWVCIERDPTIFDAAVEELRNGGRDR